MFLAGPPAGATACACGEFNGKVVAHGTSLYGVPWRIKASRLPRDSATGPAVLVDFSIAAKDEYSEAGWGTVFALPVAPAFLLSAKTGVEIDRYPEGDFSGVTDGRVETLIVTMSEGEPLTIHPQLAPTGFRRNLPWLRGLRFFDEFYAAGRRPVAIAALDSEGVVIARRRGDRGSFH
jgi:hypothetical protein